MEGKGGGVNQTPDKHEGFSREVINAHLVRLRQCSDPLDRELYRVFQWLDERASLSATEFSTEAMALVRQLQQHLASGKAGTEARQDAAPTPRTDALSAELAPGWESNKAYCIRMALKSHGKLERELAEAKAAFNQIAKEGLKRADEADALRSSTRAQPVAWRYRTQNSIFQWSMWTVVSEHPGASEYKQEIVPLYEAPVPATALNLGKPINHARLEAILWRWGSGTVTLDCDDQGRFRLSVEHAEAADECYLGDNPEAVIDAVVAADAESYPKPISYHHSTDECHENEARDKATPPNVEPNLPIYPCRSCTNPQSCLANDWCAYSKPSLPPSERLTSTDSLEKLLTGYRCQHTQDGGGAHLVDVLTPPGEDSIALGKDEIYLLADYLAGELSAPSTARANNATPSSPDSSGSAVVGQTPAASMPGNGNTPTTREGSAAAPCIGEGGNGSPSGRCANAEDGCAVR